MKPDYGNNNSRARVLVSQKVNQYYKPAFLALSYLQNLYFQYA
jgi:hypothetical protein